MVTSAGTLQINVTANTVQAQQGIAGINKTIQNTVAQTQAPIQQLGNNLQKNLGSALNNVGKQLPQVSKEFKKFSEHVWTARGYLKDFSRVATGILLAQFFYQGIVQPIRAAISALWDFNSLLETTQVSFKYLMDKSADSVAVLVKQLEDLSALTPYTFETATKGAQRLLALGFSEQQIMPMLRMMADLNAATGGGADQMEALAYAFGKVQAMGKMTTRELRLFVTANIPIYKILREELGLTEKDFMKLRISASEAIPAILRGIQKFQGAADEAQKTIPGLLSSIHDYALFLGQDMLRNMWESLRGIFENVRNGLAKMREAFKIGGWQNLIATMFPPEVAQTIMIFIKSIQELGKSVWGLLKSFGPLLGVILELATVILSFLTPPLVALIRVITDTITTGMKIINVFIAWAQANTIVAQTISRLQLIVANFFGMGGTAVRTTSGWMNAQIGFNNSLKDSELSFQDLIDSFSDTGDEAIAAAEKFKPFLAAFDEVYNIPEQAGGGLEGLKDFTFPDLTMPDLTPVVDDIKKINTTLEDLYNTFPQWLKNFGQWIWDAIQSWMKWFSIFADTWNIFWMITYNVVSTIIQKIGALLFDFFVTKPMNWFGNALNNWNNFWMGIYDRGVAWFQKIGNKLYEIFVTNPLKWGGHLLDSFVEYFAWWGGVLDRWNNFWMTTYDKVSEFIRRMKDGWDDVKAWAIKIWTDITFWAVNSWDTIKSVAMGIWNNIKLSFMNVWSSVMITIQNTWINIVNGMIRGLNTLIEMLNAINPFKDIPTIPTSRLTSPTGARVSGAATGGIIYKSQLIKVGEGNKPETITPLTPQGIMPWAQAIVSAMSGQQVGNGNDSEYVAVKMKKSDLINLERQLFVIRKGETFRIAGRTV